MKYIPSKFRTLFHVRFLKRTWKYQRLKLFRAEKLYTSKNYQMFLETFKNNFPEYVYFCPFRQKEVISTPLDSIRRVYVPRQDLNSLKKTRRKDNLQEMTLHLIELLSIESSIPLEDFGVHGSIALNMHTPKSDIDFVVYGAENFRNIEDTISKLVEEGTLNYIVKNRLDAARLYKGRYQNKIFMYNAIRKLEEVDTKYGTHKYSPIKHVKFQCKISDDNEAMFRPAIYKIENCKLSRSNLAFLESKTPKFVVSMIGCYRNIAKRGSNVEVSGMLEQVKNIKTGEISHQVVVGTGMKEDEYIWPI